MLPANELILHFPIDIWKEIAAYLTPDEIASLKLACKTFNTSLSDPKLDSVWMPVLNRLHKMDPTISVNIANGTILKAVHQGMKKIDAAQQDEIHFFQNMFKQGEVYFKQIKNRGSLSPFKKAIIETSLQKISKFAEGVSLGRLQMIDTILNELNANLIYDDIESTWYKKKTKNLQTTAPMLTRIPSEIFENKDYEEFWGKLTGLDCSHQHIRFIPKEIKKCDGLSTVSFSDNKISFLPEALFECRYLLSVDCANNQLQTLPENIERFQYTSFNFQNNQLRSLPEVFNTIFQPDFDGNHLKQIPESLKTQFGEQWVEKTLSTQKKLTKEQDTVDDALLTTTSSLNTFTPAFSANSLSNNNQTEPHGTGIKREEDKQSNEDPLSKRKKRS